MYRYIVIDDEDLIRKGTIKKISRMPNVRCVGEADNGKAGIELVKELHPDFVILDIQMPEMDGMKLLPWLSEHYPSLPLIVISAYRDFDYIKQAIASSAIEYLLKPFSSEQIQRCVGQAIERISTRSRIEDEILTSRQQKENARYDLDIQMLRSLILGHHVSSTKLTSEKLSFINDTHDLIMITLYYRNQMPDISMQEWMEEQGFGDLGLYISHPDNPGLGFIILFLPPKRILSGRQMAEQVLDVLIPWAQGRQIELRAGVSQSCQDLTDLSTVYRETSEALNQQLLTGTQTRYFYRENMTPRQLVWEKTEEFLFCIDAGKAQAVECLVHELFAWYQTIPECTLADVKYHCYTLADQGRQILNFYLSAGTGTINSGSMQNVVNHIFSLSELENYYLQFFTNLASMIRPNTVYNVDDIIEQIRIYMQRNYQKNLTQEYISYLFGLNRSYLSTLFKAKTGRKFVDYLNEIRIEESKKLLAQSTNKMYYVAHQVGYDNVKYYFRVFKKYCGMTPEQYRQKLRNNSGVNGL